MDFGLAMVYLCSTLGSLSFSVKLASPTLITLPLPVFLIPCPLRSSVLVPLTLMVLLVVTSESRVNVLLFVHAFSAAEKVV